MAEIMLTKDNFDEVVLKSDKPVLVDFFAEWCGPCRMLGPVLEEFSKEYEEECVVGKVNIDEQEELAASYGIMSIPTIKVFKNGEVTKTALGFQTKDELLEHIG